MSEGGLALKPTTFVAHAGEEPDVVEIWEVEIVDCPSCDPTTHLIRAYERSKDRWVGVMYLRVVDVDDYTSSLCVEDIRAFAKSSRRTSSKRVMQVETSFIHPTFRGKGVGVALYIASAALARRLGLALAAGSCFDSTTSDEASRVWDSLSFRKSVTVGYASERVAVFDIVTRRGLRK
jgi:GNAT superfamily N-acetyltransferase